MQESAEHLTATAVERVLVIEDEEDLRALIALTLRDMGWEAHVAATGEQGIALASTVQPTVVALDLMLPDISGIEVCRRLRANPANRGMGIVLVTARSDEYDRLLGFESGADDYVVKPFSARELGLRIKALARSKAPPGAGWPTQAPFRWRGLVLDPLQHRCCARWSSRCCCCSWRAPGARSPGPTSPRSFRTKAARATCERSTRT
jgi:two-component system phosphate regulon response regulator PhoB